MIHLVLKTMIDYFGKDVLQINHALKVYGFASTISRIEKLSRKNIDIVEITAVMHDIGIPVSEQKYNSCAGKFQELEGPPIARDLLAKLKIKTEIIDRVCFIIGNHHTYSKIDDIDFQILVEADFLVNIFENKMDDKMVADVRENYFKTATGLSILDNVYN
jgi:HD superfamily phosphodiesterase